MPNDPPATIRGGPVVNNEKIPEYEWWPNGAAETYVRECNCDYCAELIERLEHERTDGQPTDPATDDGDLSLEAFTS